MTEEETFDNLKYNIIRTSNGIFYFDSNNDLHRDDGLPAMTTIHGVEHYFVHGEYQKTVYLELNSSETDQLEE